VTVARRRLAAGLLAALVLAAPPARALDQSWTANQDAKTFRLFNLPAPNCATCAVRSQDVAPGAGYLKATGANTFPFTASATIPVADVTGAVATTRTLTTTAPIRIDAGGSADFSANRTLSLSSNGITDSLFRQSAGRSLVGNPTGSTANVQDIAASAAGQVPISGASDITWQPLTPALTGATASWSVTGVRVFCVDGASGSDSNVGYADSTDTTQANVAIATAACGTVAKQTIAGVAAIIPPYGARRNAFVVLMSGTYSEPLSPLDRSGYTTYLIRGTGTNTTAGAVAFSGSTADLTYSGAATGTGMNAAGYNPTSSTTSATITLAHVGGGTPSFAAEPAKPLGLRWRWDANTATVALRNTVSAIVERVGATSVRLQAAVTYTTADVGYIEQPGVTFTTGSFVGSNTSTTFNGLASTGTWSVTRGSYTFAFCGVGSGLAGNGNSTFSQINISSLSPFPVIGPTRAETTMTATNGSMAASAHSLVVGTTLAVTGSNSLTFADNNVIGTNVTITGGGGGSLASTAVRFGGSTSTTPARVLGTMTLNGTRIVLVYDHFPSTTASYGIVLNGQNDVMFATAQTGGTKLTAGLNLTDAHGSRLWFNKDDQTTLTGAGGDIYWGRYTMVNDSHVYLDWDGVFDANTMQGAVTFPNGVLIDASPALSGTGSTIYAGTRSATMVYSFDATPIIPGDIIRFVFTDGSGVTKAQADSVANTQGALGVALGTIAPGGTGFVIASMGTARINHESGTLTTGFKPVFISAATAGKWTETKPAIARQVGWTIAENTVSFSSDNWLQPVSQIYANGALQPTERGLNWPAGFTFSDNTGASRLDMAFNPATAGAVPSTRTLTPTAPVLLDGAGSAVDLSANRTIGVAFDNTTLTLTGGNALQVGAFTGAITRAAGSTTTAFGALAAVSVLANATGSSAVPSALAAGSDGDVLQRSSGALVFAAQPYYRTMQDNGSPGLTRRTTLAALSPLEMADDAGNARTTITLEASGVSAASYTNTSLTVDTYGRITAASSGATPALATRTLTAGAGMTGGGDLSANRTFDVVANADGTIVVNANDIQAGVMQTANIAADAVTNVELANMATARLKGRVTAGTGSPEDLTGTQATTLLDVFTSSDKGLAPASGGGTTNYLRADGTWAAPSGSGAPTNATYITQTADATLTNEQALTSLTDGVMLKTSGGVVSSYAATSTRVQLGATSGGGLTDSANLTFASNTLTVTGTTPLVFGAGATGVKMSVRDPDNTANLAQTIWYPASGTNVMPVFYVSPRGTGFNATNKAEFSIFNSDYVASTSNYEILTVRAAGSQYLIATGKAGTGTLRPLTLSAGGASAPTTNTTQLVLNTDNTVTMSSLTNGLVKTTSGVLSNATAGTDYESPLTFSTGLTRATNTVTANLSTGVSGGQSVVGGTASGNSLTLSSTTNATKGRILNGSWFALDEVNNRVLIGTQTAGVGAPLTIASSASSVAIALTQSADQFIEKQGTGTFYVGTLGAQALGLYTNNATKLTIQSGGEVDLTSLSAGGFVKAATTTGRLSVVTGAPSASYKWSIYATGYSAFGILDDHEVVIPMADTGMINTTTTFGLNQAAGNQAPNALAAAMGTATTPTFYISPTAFTGCDFSVQIPYAVATGSGTADLRVSLYKTTNPASAGAYTEIAFTTVNFSAGTLSTFSSTTCSAGIGAGDRFMAVIHRSDTNASLAVSPVDVRATVEFYK